jgi:signal transduction histidine kinase/CheY-like chemotaxis protein
MKNLWFKLMVTVLVICIAAMGIVTIGQMISSGNILINQSLSRVEYNGSLVASRLNGWLENQIGYLNAVAGDPRWLIDSYNIEALRPVIEAHYKNIRNDFFQMYFGYPDGSSWFSSGWEPEENIYRADERPWYVGAEEDPSRVFISDPYLDEASGKICVAFSRAVLRNGEVVAVVGANILLDSIRNIVNEIPIYEGAGFAFLVAENSGIVLVHRNADYTPAKDGQGHTINEIAEGVYRPLMETADGESTFIARPDGTRRYYNSHTIPSAGWRLFSAVNQDTIRDPIERQTRFQVFLSILALIFICVLLAVTSRAMSRAAQTAREHSDMKTTFLASMSHEIRTPMNGIIGFAELALENTTIDRRSRDYLEKIRNSAKDLLSILNDILDISKIEAGKVTLEKIPFNLHDLLIAAENTISLKAAEKEITLYVYSEPFIEYKLLGDPTKLRQILLNLLSNAIKFTNVGTVKLMVTVEKNIPGKVMLRFEVKDSGIGMTQAQMVKIFKPFEQADKGTTRRYGGTGLGLPITKNLIELMGGKLMVESAPGIGSKFSFIQEFELSDKRVENQEKELANAIIQRPMFSGRILICEDNVMNQEVIKDHLERIGLEAVIRGNGRQGVDAIRESMQEEKPFELIFMDIHMPVMDGLEASAEIKRIGCTTPIVALTANVLTQDTDIYYRYGIVDHLGKPFTAQELWDCLLKYLTPVSMSPISDSGNAPAGQEDPVLVGSVSPPAQAAGKEQESVVDYQIGLNMTAGNQDLYEKLRRDFYTHNRDFFDGFCALLGEDLVDGAGIGGGEDKDNLITAHRLVHTIKSSAALIGAKKLHAAAMEMEATLVGGKATYTQEQLAKLREALEATLEVLEKESGASPA